MILKGSLLALDASAVLISLMLAYTLRISSGLLPYAARYSETVYLVFALVSVPIWLCLFAMFGSYQQDILLGGVTEYKRVIRSCTAGVIAIIVLSVFWRDSAEISRMWLLFSWVISCVLVGLGRFIARRLAYRLRRYGWFTARVLVVGANDQGIAIARQWLHAPASGMQIVGFVDDFKPLGTPVLDGLKVMGRPTALGELTRQMNVHEVIVVPNAVAWETFEEIVARTSAPNGYTLRLSPGFYGMLTTGVAITNKTFVPLFTINEARIVGIEAALKAFLDYGLGAPLALLTAPIMLLIATSLKLVNPGRPVLARHQAVGQGGATFSMFKFNLRIGSANKAARPGPSTRPIWSSASRLEQVLYRTGLDKLPQLLNVVAGQMSLVGPRPQVRGEETDPLMGRNLQTVKPGIIGPWAVTEYWTSADEVQNDLYYVRNWTIWLDLQILFQTMLSLITTGLRVRPAKGDMPHAPRTLALAGSARERPARPLAAVSHSGKPVTRPLYASLLPRGGESKVYRHYDVRHDWR